MTWWIWLLLGFFLMLLELFLPSGFFLIFFGCGAMIVGGLVAIGVSGPTWMQFLLFSIFSIIIALFFRRKIMGKPRTVHGNNKEIDTLVGEMALLLEDIAVDAVGKVELRGASWNARNVGDKLLTRGQRCCVEQVEGLMLLVRGK